MAQLQLAVLDDAPSLGYGAGAEVEILRSGRPTQTSDLRFCYGNVNGALDAVWAGEGGVVALRFRGVVGSRLSGQTKNMERGIFAIGESAVLADPAGSWLGANIGASEVWNSRHYVVRFATQRLEVVCAFLEYVSELDGDVETVWRDLTDR